MTEQDLKDWFTKHCDVSYVTKDGKFFVEAEVDLAKLLEWIEMMTAQNY